MVLQGGFKYSHLNCLILTPPSGTCDNSQVNDCRAPNGQVESCSTSARQWSVPGKPCVPPFSPYTLKPPQCEAVLCEVLTSR